MARIGTAKWVGSGKEGSGTVSTQSGALKDAGYTHSSRFADGVGTSPEELVAAAHAGCYSMKLSFILGDAGFVPTSIDTEAAAEFREGRIAEMRLTTTAVVPGMSAEAFQEAAEKAKATCPISNSINADITLTATLAS